MNQPEYLWTLEFVQVRIFIKTDQFYPTEMLIFVKINWTTSTIQTICNVLNENLFDKKILIKIFLIRYRTIYLLNIFYIYLDILESNVFLLWCSHKKKVSVFKRFRQNTNKVIKLKDNKVVLKLINLAAKSICLITKS
jgi:hypothetical protein